MKKVLALFMLTFTILGAYNSGAFCASASVNDDLSDGSALYSSSSNIVFESKDKLGSYANPDYATSNAGELTMVYKLNNMASFSVSTLNYDNMESIAFYVSSNSDASFTQVTDVNRQEEALGSKWKLITYAATLGNYDNSYLKIVVTQEKSKYIRVDKVQIQSFEPIQILVNRNEINVGESLCPIIRYFDNGAEVPSMDFKSTLYSKNERVVAVDGDTLIAVGVGKTQVYAEITYNGNLSTSNIIDICVTDEILNKASIVLPKYILKVGERIAPSIVAVNQQGSIVDDFDVKYSIEGGACSIADGYIVAKAEGTSQISATIQYKGNTYSASEVEVRVIKDTTAYFKDFTIDTTWVNVFSHSDNVIIYGDSGAFASNDGVENNNIVFVADSPIDTIKFTAYYINDRGDDDIQLWVSADNKEFVRIDEADMSVDTTVDPEAPSWSYVDFSYNGDMLKDVSYVKIVFDRPASEHTQGIRLHRITMDYAVAPVVVDAVALDETGCITDKTNANMVSVYLLGNIQENTLDNITVVDPNGAIVGKNGVLDDNVYNVPIDCKVLGTYEVRVVGIEGINGQMADEFYKELNLSTIETITVKQVDYESGVVNATFTNNTNDSINASLIVVVFDRLGRMCDMYVDSSIEIPAGLNDYTCPASFTDGVSASVILCRDLVNLDLLN